MVISGQYPVRADAEGSRFGRGSRLALRARSSICGAAKESIVRECVCVCLSE